jgi:hypothetical protein
MSIWKTTLLPSIIVLTLLGTGRARADFVPWTYNWEPSALSVSAGTGGLSLTDEPINHAAGSSDVVVTNIRSFSSASRTLPDVFNHANFSFTLTLEDDLSKQTATLKFGGFFRGKISVNSANVQVTYTGPLTQKVVLGGHAYTVDLGNFAPPGPPAASNAGSISAHVGVDETTSTGGGGGSHQAPEPSTLVLSALGLSSLGLAGWRRLRPKRLA